MSAFAKLRCHVLPLSKEISRYNNVNLEERICEFCLLNEFEDENHFVCRCTKYLIHRQHLYSIVSSENINFISRFDNDKLTYLMKNKQRQLSKYTWLTYTSHRKMLYNS